ncbi:unnamed protein product, partial [Lymnaea stagnalis]
MPAGDKQVKPKESDRDAKQLCHLLALISAPASRQPLPSVKYPVSLRSPTTESIPILRPGTCANLASEASELQNFSLKYKDERQFSSHPHH